MTSHCIKPKIYTKKENRPKNFAIGVEKFAPNKKLKRYWMNLYKFIDGASHSLHEIEFIKLMQVG